MQYRNPVILSDYSDPDVIRVGKDFYMVASSFNHVPGVPVLHSKNLVEWELINHVLPEIPFERFNRVCHGAGAWAPSLRYHDGKFYCLIPFPDEGIFVSETTDPYGEWSQLRPVLLGKGYEDPCPIWGDGKCYVVFSFVKSRIGFNSKLAVFETDEMLTKIAENYKFVYDGHDNNPTIEGPKFYKRGKYFHILAPAGGVSSGWQVALRSENIYGPYESKIILMQGGTEINGPHQGALIDLDDEGNKWAFMHFQDMGPYGRIVHLQPAEWVNDWVLCGAFNDDNLPGQPVEYGEYPVDVKTDYKIEPSDEFKGCKLSLVWQNPANRKRSWFKIENGLQLNCEFYGKNAISDLPQLFMQKVCYKNFMVNCKCKLNLVNDGDEIGFVVFGTEYSYICAVKKDGRNYLEIRKGVMGGEKDEIICQSQPYNKEYVTFSIRAKYEERHRLSIKYAFDGKAFKQKFYAVPGKWVGAKVGIYARANSISQGFGTFKYFRVTCTDK
ncbi:MAG: glycoside hydrolase 43 family protein [Clostridia bacterium]|nr:glycoside hydrolase 43 family protein [Clostridia bacterium]